MYRLVLLIVCLGGAAGWAQAHGQACQADEMRVMTYNIRLDTESDGSNRWALRKDLLISQIRLLKPAVLGLQEVLPNQRDDLVSALPHYAVLGGGRDDGKRKGEASPLLVDSDRFAVRSHGMFWLSPTPLVPSKGWDAAWLRIATWAHLTRRADGLRILAINVHWDNEGKVARRNSASVIRDWLTRNREAGEQALVLGDFNASLDEDSLQNLMRPAGDGLLLHDSRATSREVAIGSTATFNDWNPAPAAARPIDHILVTPDFTVQRYHALAELFDGRLASDHFPVIADVSRAACTRSRP